MVISSKTEEQSLPITPAAPAPCTHRMSSPFPRKQERAGMGDRGPVHCTSLREPPPSSAGAASLANPHGFPYPPSPSPCGLPEHRLGQRCSGDPAAPGAGEDSASAGPQHPALWGFPTNPGTSSAAGASFPSGTHFGGWDGGRKGVDPDRVEGVSPVGFVSQPFYSHVCVVNESPAPRSLQYIVEEILQLAVKCIPFGRLPAA